MSLPAARPAAPAPIRHTSASNCPSAAWVGGWSSCVAVVIGVFPAADRLAVEKALPGSPVKSVVESDEKGLDELKRALGEAMGKFNPDRTVLPVPDKAFGGVAQRSTNLVGRHLRPARGHIEAAVVGEAGKCGGTKVEGRRGAAGADIIHHGHAP